MLEEYTERRRIVLEALSHLPFLRCPTSNGAFYVFPEVSALEQDSIKFSKHLIKEGHVVVSPGVAFGSAGEGYIRLSYASAKEKLKIALTRIQKVIEKYPELK
jgi:aminotransferase